MFDQNLYNKIEFEIDKINRYIGKKSYYIYDMYGELWICKKFLLSVDYDVVDGGGGGGGQCYFSFPKNGCNYKSMGMFYKEWLKEDINYDNNIDKILINILSRKKKIEKLLTVL